MKLQKSERLKARRYGRPALFAAALGASVLGMASSASAASVLATYYKATAGGDFEKVCCDTNITVGATLGPDGLPVYAPVGGDETVLELDASNQILWWTDDAGGHIDLEGSAIVALPLADSNMFTPMGTGGGNGGANGYQTAVLSGFFNAANGHNINFNARSDDDLFLFIDGKYVDLGLSGIHGPQTTNTPYQVVGSGVHTFKLFYADRHTTQAELHFGVEGVNLTATVPEPATWAMMILGFGAAGTMVRRRRAAIA